MEMYITVTVEPLIYNEVLGLIRTILWLQE